MCVSVCKADLSDNFESKQSRKAVDLPLTYHPSPCFTTFVFRSSEVKSLLLDLDPCGGTDPLGMFPLFIKRTADVMAPRLSVVFPRLVRLGSFPAYWRQANVVPIPKAPPSSSLANYRASFITSVLSKVFECLVSIRLGRFIECSGVSNHPVCLSERSGTCDAFVCPINCSVLESGQEARIMQIDFSAAFDRVNHQGILNKLCSVGVGGSVLSILTQFLSNQSPHIMVDGCRSKLVNVISVVLCSVLGLLLFLMYTSELIFLHGTGK